MDNEINTQENVAVLTTGKDLATSILIVSLLINVTVLIAWLLVVVDPAISVAVSVK